MLSQRGWRRQRESKDGIFKGKAKETWEEEEEEEEEEEDKQEEKKDFEEKAFGGTKKKKTLKFQQNGLSCLFPAKQRKKQNRNPNQTKTKKGRFKNYVC